MSPKPWKLATALLVSTALGMIPVAEACNTSGNTGGGRVTVTKPNCSGGGGVTVNKPVTINKPVTVNKNITINKTIDASKNITINKTIDASKNITINKSIVINKGGSGDVSATVSAIASAYASASASTNVIVYGGGYSEYVTVNPTRGEIGVINAVARADAQCVMQEATVIKSLHAVCVSPDGREFPASHMVGETWIDSGYEGEVLRCIPGSHLKITVGDVLQSDQGLAGTYQSGQMLECASTEALRHFKDGMLKCVPKVAVKDCTERSNLRRWGTGDMFFSFRTQVCVEQKTVARAKQSREIELDGLTLNGGVGDQ